MKEVDKIPFYKNPMIYSGLISIVGLILLLYSVFQNKSDFIIIGVVVFGIFGVLTYFMWNSRCPKCNRIFVKKEKLEWKEDLGIRKEPYKYYSKIYEYPDGTREVVSGSEKTIMRERKYDRHYFICKKCGYGSDKEWKEDSGIWLGENPKQEIIRKKGSENSNSYNKKKRVPIGSKLRREIYERADNCCQHCGHSFSLDIHHIDENPANNNKDNLILLCKNCHGQVGAISKIALKNECKKSYRKAKTFNIYKNS